MSETKQFFNVVLQKIEKETEESQGVKKICDILRKLDISDERKKELQEVRNTLPDSYDHETFKRRQLQKYRTHQFPEYKEREYRVALVEQAKHIRQRESDKYEVDLVYKDSQRLRLPRHLAETSDNRRQHDVDTIVKANMKRKPDVTDPSFRFPQAGGQTYPTDYRGELLTTDNRPFISPKPNSTEQERNCYQNFYDGQLDMEATLDRMLDLFTSLAYGKAHAINAFRQIIKGYFPHLLHTSKDMDDEQILETILDEYSEFDPKRNLARYIEQLDRSKGQTYRSAMTQLVIAIRQLEEYKRTTLYTTEKAIHNHPLVIKAYTNYAPASIRANLAERISYQNMYRDNVDFEDICNIVQRYERSMTAAEIEQEVKSKVLHSVQMVSQTEQVSKKPANSVKTQEGSKSRSPSIPRDTQRQQSSGGRQRREEPRDPEKDREQRWGRGRNEEYGGQNNSYRNQYPQGERLNRQNTDSTRNRTPDRYWTDNWNRNSTANRQDRQSSNYRESRAPDYNWTDNRNGQGPANRQRWQSRDDRRFRTPERRGPENSYGNNQRRQQSRSPQGRYYSRSTQDRGRQTQREGDNRGRSTERQFTNYRRENSRDRQTQYRRENSRDRQNQERRTNSRDRQNQYYQDEGSRSSQNQYGNRNRSRSQDNWGRSGNFQQTRRRTQSPRERYNFRDNSQNRSQQSDPNRDRPQRMENSLKPTPPSPGYPRDKFNTHRGNDGNSYYRPTEMGTRPWTINRDQRRFNRKFSQDGREYRQFFDASPSRNSSPWRQFNNNAKASGRNDRTRSNSPEQGTNVKQYGSIQDGVYVTKNVKGDEQTNF